MRSFGVVVLLALACTGPASRVSSDHRALEVLRASNGVDLTPIGFDRSNEDLASFATLLHSAQAAASFQSLLSSGAPSAATWGLAGLRVVDMAAYPLHYRDYLEAHHDQAVDFFAYDTVRQLSGVEVVQALARGELVGQMLVLALDSKDLRIAAPNPPLLADGASPCR